MRAIDADAIVVHKFPSEDYDPSENDAEKAYRKGWNDALDAVTEFQPSAEPVRNCNTCRYNDLEWYEEPCDSCTMGGETNHYKPSTEPVRIKGRWVKQIDESINAWWYECSVCGDYPLKDAFGHDSLSQFCPWCGTQMSEGEEDE